MAYLDAMEHLEGVLDGYRRITAIDEVALVLHQFQ